MISTSLVRGYNESTKGPTQPPDTARWIWYKKTDSHTVNTYSSSNICIGKSELHISKHIRFLHEHHFENLH